MGGEKVLIKDSEHQVVCLQAPIQGEHSQHPVSQSTHSIQLPLINFLSLLF